MGSVVVVVQWVPIVRYQIDAINIIHISIIIIVNAVAGDFAWGILGKMFLSIIIIVNAVAGDFA
jgi:hypothetical protein